MKKSVVLLMLFHCWLSFSAYAEEKIKWPLPDWEMVNNQERLNTPECKNFQHFAINSKDFLTDGLIIIKDGMLHFEYYDEHYSPVTLHSMWSVSKTITGALLGIAVRDGRITMDERLSTFFPKDFFDPNYENITMSNLLYMDAGFLWEEDRKDVKENRVINMLYGYGHKNMARYVAHGPLVKEGPGYQWIYSSGVPTLTMGVLKKVYGEKDSLMPWRNLFNPLGMHSAVFERDLSGTFVGGTSIYITLRDMAKLGYLYLNRGVWNGEVILTKDWIEKMLTPSPGFLSPGNKIDPFDRGVYGGAMWLNVELKKGQGRPFPNVPEDMYMAIGFNGQLLIMIPSLKMIIVRTGRDAEFRSKINEFISRAIQCFVDPSHVVGKGKPAEDPTKLSPVQLLKNINSAVDNNTLQASIAKLVCSCHYISGLDIPLCLERNNFSLAKYFTKMSIKENKEESGELSINVKLTKLSHLFRHKLGPPAKAVFNPASPEFGCTLK